MLLTFEKNGNITDDTLTPSAEIPLYYIKNEPAKSANMPKPICVCDIFLPRCQC